MPLQNIGEGMTDEEYITYLESFNKDEPRGGILFYGASNFRLWPYIHEDLAPWHIINHGFGGATDPDLIQYAPRLLYPFQPSVVFIQTGSNDLASGLSLEQIKANKDTMYSLFRQSLPDTTFVVMSSLPLPGRKALWPDSQKTNDYLRAYCSAHDNMLFVDATDAMLKDGGFRPDFFVEDQIHLNRIGQKAWATLIKQALEQICPL